MRFAFISTMHGWQWGGSEELWSQAAIQLRKAGHDVQASVGYWPRLSNKAIALSQHRIGLETHSSGQGGPVRRIWDRLSHRNRKSYDRLKQFNPDLVLISQGHNSGGFDWAKVCQEAEIPYVIIVHCNFEQWSFEEQLGDAKLSYANALRVFCVSQKNLDLLRLQLSEPLLNAEVVRNPYNISPERLLPWPDESGMSRLACVARMDPKAKGQDLLLQVLGLPEWRDRTVELNFFGTGSAEPKLRRMAGALQLNNVHFRGHVNDVGSIWQQNHLLVLPSRYEGLPLALVEAMWCARPAVVTDIGGNAELCLDDETGFVAPAATVSCFAHALERAWGRRKDWQHMGQAARIRVESQIPKDPVGVFCERLKACAAGQPRENPW
jgi:glycosyltransferase involved in cell wall biosynthesis